MTYLNDELEAERRIINAATEGPWIPHDMSDADYNTDDGAGWWWVWQESRLPYYGGVLDIDPRNQAGEIGEAAITDGRNGKQEHADATFIAHARTALPVRNAQVEDVLAKCDDWEKEGEHWMEEWRKNQSAENIPMLSHGAELVELARRVRRAIEEAGR